MSRIVDIDDTLTAHPSSFDDDASSYASISSSYPVDYAYDGSDSTNYAQFSITTGSNAYTYIYYNFDFSSIPAGATINSVSASAKVYINTTNSSRITTRTVQLYSGSTAKGSAYTFSNSTTAFDLTPGTWTLAELQNARLGIIVRRGTSNTTSTYSVRVYGATFTVSYSVSGTVYDITAASNVEDITVEPATQEVYEGESATITIDAASLDDIEVLDNNDDVTDQLVQKTKPTGGTIERYPNSYQTSGSISGTNYQYCIGRGSDTAASSGNDYCSSSGSTAYINYSFDFSDIPENATIESVSLSVKGHCESTSNSSEVAQLQAYSGTTAKGSEVSFTSTSDTVKEMSIGTWTRAELQNAILRFTIGYYGGKVVGATWEVTYSVPSSGNPYYYEYVISNVNADHIVIINETGPFIPPEEDEGYTYYPVTVSSINAVTTPHSGTTRIKEGENVTVEIKPTDPKLTLALDNGVDITSQLVNTTGEASYTVTTASGASYGFNLNSSTGYYTSTNDGVSQSASVARVNLSLPTDAVVTFSFINYAEATYDYGIFGNVDDPLDTTWTADSDAKLVCSASSQNTSSVQTLTYEVSAGEHFIDVKYRKDQATDSNNDNLQFKLSIETTGVGEYSYTLNNIQQSHSLIFVFGDVEYYFVNSTGSDAKLYPSGQSVVLKNFSYKLVIVPNDSSATVTATDNNTDITSQLTREETTDSKTGKLIVNYVYEIADVVAAHDIIVTSGSVQKIFLKVNDTWRECSKVYVKTNGAWVEQSDLTTVFSTSVNYVKGN